MQEEKKIRIREIKIEQKEEENEVGYEEYVWSEMLNCYEYLLFADYTCLQDIEVWACQNIW